MKLKLKFIIQIRILYIIIGILAFNVSAFSQDVDDLFELSLEELMQIEVTSATKSSLSLQEAPSSIKVFTQEDFKKVNGFRESDNVYVVDVEYDLVFQKSFVEVVREIRENPTGPQYGMFCSKLVLAAIQSNFGQFSAGDKLHKQDSITLHNTEQGWQLAR